MPTITPVFQEGTMTIQHNTQMPSAQLAQKQQVQTTQSPTSTPPSTTETAPEEAVSLDQKKLRALLNREKQIVNARKKLEQEQKELEMHKASSRQWMEAAELAKDNKLEALAKLGITYDDLTQQILSGGQVPPAQIARQEARNELEEYKKQQKLEAAENQKSQYAEGLKHVTNEIKYMVEAEADKYPLVKLDGSYEDIAKWIESEFHRTGRITPVEDAIERWENDALSGLEELAKIEKVRNKFTPQDRQQPTSPKPTAHQVAQTLNQRATAPIPSPKPMSDAERRQRAIDAFYGRIMP